MFSRKSTRRGKKDNGGSTNVNGSPALPDSPTDRTLFDTSYARRCKELMDLNKDLAALGAGSFLDLPRLAVIGSQSAGKSSLVEAVSGIGVPRDSGTCTRCPMECSMSTSAASWSCSISLQIFDNADGTPLAAPETIPFVSDLTDKTHVALWLVRAQAAILNRHLPYRDFKTKSEVELKKAPQDPNTLPFSKNMVLIEVKDPASTDLSFIDLPGLIQNSALNDIALIQDLVESHIEGENTLILVTIPMTDDLQNQAALRLAREADSDGERTIGVLTKPDALTKGAVGNRQKWRDVIVGQSHPLKHGYYCVRLPDDDERKRNLSRAESQKVAADFFETTAPWNEIADRNRFGVPSFVASISGLLVKLIERNLPKLKEKVQELLDDCEAQLRLLPAVTTGEPMTEVCNRITKFCADFQSAVSGESHKLNLVQPNKRRYDEFKDEIFRTRPNFLTFLPSFPRGSDYFKVQTNENAKPPVGPLIDVNRVKQAIADSVGWELPTHVPYYATKNFIRGFTSQCDDLALSCFNDVFATTSNFVRKSVAEHFGQFQAFETQVAAIVQHELDECRDETQHTLSNLILKLEQVPFYTQNTEFFYSQGRFWWEYYHGGAGHILYDFERSGNDDAIKVMADVRAYFQVAYKRIIDYVPLTIEHELNQALAAQLQDSLLNRFLGKMGTPDQMKALLTEDPTLAKKREFLEDRRTRLQQIKRRLEEVRKEGLNDALDNTAESFE